MKDNMIMKVRKYVDMNNTKILHIKNVGSALSGGT